MRAPETLLLAALSLAGPAAGQEPAAQPAFEVASVRVNKSPLPLPPATRAGEMPPPPPPPSSFRTSPQTLTVVRATLMECLTWAYDVRRWQISAPDWFTADHYDIMARAAAPASEDQLKQMLQRLLADRFRMAIRREKKEAPVMALLVDKAGPKLQASAPDTLPSLDASFVHATGGIRFSFRNMPIHRLEGLLSGADWDPVINMTGLAGGFDFVYERPQLEDGSGSSLNLGRIQAALENQLGLKLERRKLPVALLVIDRASRIPSEN